MKRRTALIAATACIATMLTAVFAAPLKLVWNTTASVPTGLYFIGKRGELHVGDRIAIKPPSALREFLAERGYLPPGVPLIKQVAALPGSRICRNESVVTIDGRVVAIARSNDTLGRPLPVWRGCHLLGPSELFVLNPAAPASFDSRYFGPLARDRVVGRAIPLWTDERGNGDHVWLATTSVHSDRLHDKGDNQ